MLLKKIDITPQSKEINELKEEIFQLSEEKQRQLYYLSKFTNNVNSKLCSFIQMGYHQNTVCEYDDKITITHQERIFHFNKKIYTKSTKFFGLTIYKKTKKVKFWNCSISEMRQYIFSFFKILGYDWFTTLHYFQRNLITSSILIDIIFGKITNPEQYLKKWIKVSLKYPLHFNLMKKLLQAKFNNDLGDLKFLRLIIENIDNPNAFIENVYLSKNFGYTEKRLLEDMFLQCQILNKKIKWNWSSKRLNAEHLKMTREIMGLTLKDLNKTPIKMFGTLPLPDSATGKLIESEYEAYIEGMEQHNCVYTNYWGKIKYKHYFIISLSKPQRCSLGISKKPKGDFYIDQLYLAHNLIPEKETIMIFDEWIRRNDVQHFFHNNFQNFDEKLTKEFFESVEAIEEPKMEMLKNGFGCNCMSREMVNAF